MKLHNHKKSVIDSEDIKTGRLEALVDGVFAIAMTLLVFNIHLPELPKTASAHDLLLSLVTILPSIASFAISFIILGMFWVGHHTEFRFIKKLDHKLIWYNIFYLLFISFLPFTAQLLGSYHNNQVAIIVYGLHLIIMVVIHYLMWQHAKNHANLLTDNMDLRIHALVNRLTLFAVVSYSAAIALSFWRPEPALIMYVLVPLPYIFGWIYRLV